MFDLIKNISAVDSDSWKKKLFITIDIDWAIDEILAKTVNLLERQKGKATFFITHQSDLIKDLQNNPNFELGIHPNFNYLLNGDSKYGKNYKEVIDYYLKLAPTAKSFRSHSLTVNSMIIDYISSLGLTHECNLFIPFDAAIQVRPIIQLDKKGIRVPHGFEDDVLLINTQDINKYELSFSPDNLNVLDFHPIHIFLNSNSLINYHQSKEYFRDYTSIKRYINKDQNGICNIFESLLEQFTFSDYSDIKPS